MREKRGHQVFVYAGVGRTCRARCGRFLLKNEASRRWWAAGCPWDLDD